MTFRRKWMRVWLMRGAALLWTTAMALSVRAQVTRSDKEEAPQAPYRVRRPAPSPRLVETYASVSAGADSNVNHMLVNSTLPSDTGPSDTVLRGGAGVALRPAWGPVKAELGYDFDKWAFQKQNVFSYYNQSLSGALSLAVARAWTLETAGSMEWTADSTGGIANARSARAGLGWQVRPRVKLKGYWERRRDNILVNALKNADSNGAGFLALGSLSRTSQVFANWRFQDHQAAGNDYSYRSHALSLGLIHRLSPAVKIVGIGSFQSKNYDNVDSRFLVRRRDRTYSLSAKPSWSFAPHLSAVGAVTYSHNASNVAAKSYSDLTYSMGLEGRY